MNITKHNLSAGTAKLNLDNLIQLAEVASGLSKVECEREISKLQSASFSGHLWEAKHAAINLASAANSAAIAFESLCVLKESKNREEIIVVK